MRKTSKNFAITFCDQAESGGTGRSNAGKIVQPGKGYTLTDLQRIRSNFPDHAYSLIDISRELLKGITGDDVKSVVIRRMLATKPKAYLLIVRGAAKTMLGGDTQPVFAQLSALPWDKKKGPRKKGGAPLNKRTRYNLCFGYTAEDPDYTIGQATVMAYTDAKVSQVRVLNEYLEKFMGERLVAEGNYYYKEDSGIRYHGDTTRRKVIGVRFGATRRLHFQHFLKFMAVGANGAVEVRDGDMYAFSEHAVGTDWKSSAKLTLRHAVGMGHWAEKDGKKFWEVEGLKPLREPKLTQFQYIGRAKWTRPTSLRAREGFDRRQEAFDAFMKKLAKSAKPVKHARPAACEGINLPADKKKRGKGE